MAAETIRVHLLQTVPNEVLAINRASGFPLYLCNDPQIPVNEVRFQWTSTGLAVIRINENTNPTQSIKNAAVGRILQLCEIASGSPLSMNTDDFDLLQLSGATVDTIQLLRAFPRYGRHNLNISDFLPPLAVRHVQTLGEQLRAQNTILDPILRLGAILVEGGLAPDAKLRTSVKRKWPRISRLVSHLIRIDPVSAATHAWIFATNPPKHGEVTWVMPFRRNVTARRPHAKVLLAIADAIMASTNVNSKGSAFSPEGLISLAQQAKAKPFVYFDHDRSQPPGIVMLDVQYHCHGSEHLVSGTFGAFTSAAVKRFENGAGLSPAFGMGR